MEGRYDALLVTLAILVAVAASYTALNLAARRPTQTGRASLAWLLAGSMSMGIGIWSMHFIGMLAFSLPIPIAYDPVLTALSLLFAVGASALALHVVGAATIRPGRMIASAALMGGGISLMHYVGMAAIEVAPGIEYDLPLLVASILVAFGALGLLGITVLSSVFEAHLHGPTQRLNESLRQANAELTHLATHDPLTGLPNRALLADRIGQAIVEARKDASRFAVLFVDLDRFKFVNDSVGHRIGDALLRAAAHRINARLGRADTLARLGGDEFVVLLKAIGTPQRAADVARQIRRELETAFRIDVHELHISATIGICVYPTDGNSVDMLLTNADAAMYHAKQAGRDTFQFFTPEMNAFAQERLEIENGLRRALQNDEFVLHYQPKVDIGSGEVCAMEALVRWRHPTRGLVRPDVFIPVAEETGLIGPLGEWVLRTACRQNKAWQQAGLKPMRMAVNLSAKQFRQSRLLDFIRRTLDSTGLEARYLELELTESTVMSHPEESVRILQSLSGMGVHIAIDDFGTGYSSLAYLKRLPLDKLKVDRSFVKDLASNPDDASIVQAVISMAHSLRLKVIAEGVETVEQLELLRSLGCDQFQGFYFSAAVAAPEARRFMDPITAAADATATATADAG